MAMAEIEVFGGGIFGLSVAYACQKRGAKVRLIEKRNIGAGASGGLLGALAPHTPDNWNDKKQFQYESLIASADYWAEIDALSGLSSGFGRIGRLVSLPDARTLELAHARVASAAHFWRGLAQWSVIPQGEFPNWEPISPTGFFSHDTLSARINPRAACTSLHQAFQAIGGEVLLGTDQGFGADVSVLATGYEGLLALSAELDAPVGKGVKGQGVLLEWDAVGLPQIFADGIHFIPHENGSVALGSTTEIDWQDPTSTDQSLDQLIEKAKGILPQLRDAPVLSRWAGVRPRARRRAPILGPHPTKERVFIANGGFKIGFGMSVRVGEVMADLILDGCADIPAGFSLEANLTAKAVAG